MATSVEHNTGGGNTVTVTFGAIIGNIRGPQGIQGEQGPKR